jgi:pyruvate dehydrogenase E2 component (dihydrolipoamide acetyltransferase)
MATIIDMPKLSDTMTTGTLVKWLKNEGDTVASGMMIAEIETDKATMELECFDDGVLLKQVAAVGAQIAVGEPICVIGKKGEDISDLKLGSPAPAEKSPDAKSEYKPEDEDAEKDDSEDDVEDESEEKPGKEPAEKKKAEAKKEPKPEQAKSEGKEENGDSGQTTSKAPSAAPSSGRVRISPLARKMAEELKVDYSRLTGSGPGGRIVRADIAAAKDKPAAAKGGAPASAGVFKGPVAEQKDMPLSNMRATIAKRLLEAKTQIPHFYLEIEVDAAPLLALRQTLNTELE